MELLKKKKKRDINIRRLLGTYTLHMLEDLVKKLEYNCRF